MVIGCKLSTLLALVFEESRLLKISTFLNAGKNTGLGMLYRANFSNQEDKTASSESQYIASVDAQSSQIAELAQGERGYDRGTIWCQ